MDAYEPTSEVSSSAADAQAGGADRGLTIAEAEAALDAILKVGPPPEVACQRCAREGTLIFRDVRLLCPLLGTDECYQSRIRERLWQESGIGSRYQKAEWAKVSDTIAKLLRSFCDGIGTGTNLILLGGVGTGKTCALSLVARAAVDSGARVAWRYTPALFDQLHKGDPAAEVARMAELLVLDDFGVQYASDWPMSRFDALVEYRYSEYKPVAVSTNREWEDLTADPLYSRIVSRWREDAVIIATGGEDRRGREKRG